MKLKKSSTAAGRPREFDMTSALDRAMHVFWKKGYLGTSLSDLTKAMGISRPSLYAAFGNKEELFLKTLLQYSEGPSAYLREALEEPTARAVVEKMLRGSVTRGTDPCNPPGCLWVHGALSSGDPECAVRKKFHERLADREVVLAKRFKRAISDGDLPTGSDPTGLARYVITINCGLAVQAAIGSTRRQLMQVVDTVLKVWPK